MITHEIKKKVALFIKETVGGGTIKLGTGGGSTNPTATDLDVPLSTTESITATSSDDKVIEFSGSFSGGNLQGYTIREMGIFGTMPQDDQFDDMVDNTRTSGSTEATDSTYATETTMLSRVNFEAIGNFSTSDTIDIIYTMEVE